MSSTTVFHDVACTICGCACDDLRLAVQNGRIVRVAVRLAERIGANIDTTASLCHAASVMAIQEVGESTCLEPDPRKDRGRI